MTFNKCSKLIILYFSSLMAYRRYRGLVKVEREVVTKKWKELTASSPVAEVFEPRDFDAFLKKECPFSKIAVDPVWRRSLSMVAFEHQNNLCNDCTLASKHIYLYFLNELVD